MLNAANKGILTECDALYPFTVQPRVTDPNGLNLAHPGATYWQASNLLTGWESPYWRTTYAKAEADAMAAYEAETVRVILAWKPTCGGCESYAGTKYS